MPEFCNRLETNFQVPVNVRQTEQRFELELIALGWKKGISKSRPAVTC
jgi:hypothetical protein